MKDLGTLSSGFPKVIDHKDKPGLPEGKRSLLLGYCANRRAANVVKYFKGALPGLAWYRVPAEGLALACPAETNPYGDASLVSRKAKVGKDELSVVAFITEPPVEKEPSGSKSRSLSIQAFVRDKAGHLVVAHQQRLPGNAYLPPKIKPSEGGLAVQIPVDLGHYPSCKTSPTYTLTEQITVEDGKITVTESEGPKPSCICCQGE